LQGWGIFGLDLLCLPMKSAPLRFPGRYCLFEGFLHATPHSGWFEPGSAFYGESFAAKLAVRAQLAAKQYIVADPAVKLEGTSSFWLHRAATQCPAIALTTDSAQDVRRSGLQVVSFSWTSASNSGEVFDSATGRTASVSFEAYSLEPLPSREAEGAAEALGCHFSREERERLAHELMRGISAARVEAWQIPALAPSLDRLLQWVSDGALDEEAVELSLRLCEATCSDERIGQDWESELWPLMDDDAAAGEAAKALEALEAIDGKDAADTPWGPGFLLTLPGIRFDSGDRLPPAAGWYFPDAGH
jgi:hypothetical protein